jgi:hypothetical protein
MRGRFYSWLPATVVGLLLLTCDGCSSKTDNPVPVVAVDFTLYLNQPGFSALSAVGGWVYVTGGSRGIIVYHLNVDTFMAFDRNCTYNPTAADARVSVDNTGLFAADTSCGSKFVLIDGSVSQGPATIGLRQYHADYDGLNAVHVYN